LFDILLVGGLLVSFNPLENAQMKRLLLVLVPTLLSAQTWTRDSTRNGMDGGWDYQVTTVARTPSAFLILAQMCDAGEAGHPIHLMFSGNSAAERYDLSHVPVRVKVDSGTPEKHWFLVGTDGTVFSLAAGEENVLTPEVLAMAREVRIEVPLLRHGMVTFLFRMGKARAHMDWIRARCHS
jgi:hypothetical protein